MPFSESFTLNPKPAIGKPNDKNEQEADKVADTVVGVGKDGDQPLTNVI